MNHKTARKMGELRPHTIQKLSAIVEAFAVKATDPGASVTQAKFVLDVLTAIAELTPAKPEEFAVRTGIARPGTPFGTVTLGNGI